MPYANAATTLVRAPEELSAATDPALGSRIKEEVLLVAEIAGLCGLAFTRPILDSYGRAPEAFLARDASRADVALFALVVAVLPTAVLAVAAGATNLGGPAARRNVQIGLVGFLASVVAWRFCSDLTSWGGGVRLALAVAGAAGLASLRWKVMPVATFLRFLGGASVMFLVLFLLASPSSDLVLKGSAATGGEEMTAAVLEGTGDDPPPIVLLVLDALPTGMLLDGRGRIDASLYPNLAELAGDATWYRNHTTTSTWTFQAVPSLLTGQLPTGADLPDARSFPDNFFTLFSGTHDVNAVEQLSRLCPTDTCPRTSGSALPGLLEDAVDWWTDGVDSTEERGQILPGALEPDRADEFDEWRDSQDFAAGDPENGADRPGLWSYHMVMPHEPWNLLADGRRYDVVDDDNIYGLFLHSDWQSVGAEVARQRQLLQTVAVDRMVGDLLDDLRQDDIYDDALVVLAGDHGQAFTPDQPLRAVSDEQYDQVMWSPLIIKAPGQDEAVVEDANVQSVDVMPILAETLGFELPWEVDDLSTDGDIDQRDPALKQLLTSDMHQIEPDHGSRLLTVDGREGYERVRAARAIDEPGAGEQGIWRRTEHGDLLGQDVSGLDVATEPASAGTLQVEELDRLENQPGERLLLEVIGVGDLDRETTVAIAVNGEVAAVAPTATPLGYSVEGGEMEYEDISEDEAVVHALLHPDTFAPGADNDVTAYVVAGEPGDEILTPLEVLPG